MTSTAAGSSRSNPLSVPGFPRSGIPILAMEYDSNLTIIFRCSLWARMERRECDTDRRITAAGFSAFHTTGFLRPVRRRAVELRTLSFGNSSVHRTFSPWITWGPPAYEPPPAIRVEAAVCRLQRALYPSRIASVGAHRRSGRAQVMTKLLPVGIPVLSL